MLFEGSEKKLEVIVGPQAPDLKSLGKEFWEEVVKASQAQILSEISSESCLAYLLSESSLFVWKDHFTMITCGQTTLVPAFEKFLSQVSSNQLDAVIFERKNEYFPRHQKTDFYEDAKKLSSLMPAKAFRFGSADGHHLFLLHQDKPYRPEQTDKTLEILMYNLQGDAREIFDCQGATVETIRSRTGVHEILDGFAVDDFAFDPCGYSLNALRGDEYYTIHVTPEEQGSYVSFETNVKIDGDQVQNLILKVLGLFLPQSFDVIAFQPRGTDWLPRNLQIDGFQNKATVVDQLSGYDVLFSHHFKKSEEIQSAVQIKEFK